MTEIELPGMDGVSDLLPDDVTERDGEPWLRVVKGEPTESELAALVAVLAARRRAPANEPAVVRRSAWSAPERRLGRPLHAARGGWRAGTLPR